MFTSWGHKISAAFFIGGALPGRALALRMNTCVLDTLVPLLDDRAFGALRECGREWRE